MSKIGETFQSMREIPNQIRAMTIAMVIVAIASLFTMVFASMAVRRAN